MNRSRIHRWLETPAISNPVERGQSLVFQMMLLFVGAFGVLLALALFVALFAGPDGEQAAILPLLLLVFILIGSTLTSLVILRRGRFQAAVILIAVGFTLLHSVTLLNLGLANREILLVYLLPLTLAGLLSSRRALPAVVLIACLSVWLAAFTAPVAPLPAGELTSIGAPAPPAVVAFNFTLLIGIAAGFFVFFGNVLSDALARALARERDLDELRRSLEQTVAERTQALRLALADVEARAAAQSDLLAENSLQREVIREMSVPVLPITDTTLIMPLVGALDSRRIQEAQEQALARVERTRSRYLILDITGVPVVDTQVAQGLVHLVQSVRLLGAEAILVGIRPEVAQTIVGLGLTLEGIHTAGDVRSALRLDGLQRR